MAHKQQKMNGANRMDNVNYRLAKEKDIALVLTFIKELAAYEKLGHLVENTEELMYKALFVDKHVEVLLAEEDETPVGFALFFHNFSTFLGRAGIYLEDLYVRPAYRGKGYGKQFFKELAKIAEERNCGRIEWSCLDWNKSSIEFYKKLGAVPMDEWTVYRLTEKDYKEL
jgi:Acetyltransferases